jgi:hypothetical protein
VGTNLNDPAAVVCKRLSTAITMALLLLAAGCAGLSQPPAERLLGQWQTRLGGFAMLVDYSAAGVSVDRQPPVAYTITGNQLSFANGGSQVRILRFDGADAMIQIDPLSGTEHRFTRVR